MADSIYVMDVVVVEKREGRNIEGTYEYDEKVYENTFYFGSIRLRKTCADRIRAMKGVTVTFRHFPEHAPQTIKRMVAKRKYKPF